MQLHLEWDGRQLVIHRGCEEDMQLPLLGRSDGRHPPGIVEVTLINNTYCQEVLANN